jgi:hypothetical protein
MYRNFLAYIYINTGIGTANTITTKHFRITSRIKRSGLNDLIVIGNIYILAKKANVSTTIATTTTISGSILKHRNK